MKRYKYMLETAPDRMTLQSMRKRPDEDYKEYAIRWKNVASMVRPPLTSREENFMFVDTLPSPYYDMLIVNTFVEFRRVLFRSTAPDRMTLQSMRKRPDEDYKEYAIR